MKLKMSLLERESYATPRQRMKNRNVALPTQVLIAKAVVSPVVMPGCENRTTGALKS